MIGKLRTWLAQRRAWRHRRRKRKKKYARWLVAHPGGSYAQYYVEETRRQIDAGMMKTANIGLDVDVRFMKQRAQRILEAFRHVGCQPHHVVVDYGCGSLWIGEAFMDYLAPGNYVGLDVTDNFYVEGLARFPEGYVAERRPMLRVIAPDSLREVRDRRPDFILSTGVLMHVPPEGLTDYFANLTAVALPHTRIEIGYRTTLFDTWEPPRFWRHSRFTIGSALAAHGYKARYAARHRILASTPGIALVRR